MTFRNREEAFENAYKYLNIRVENDNLSREKNPAISLRSTPGGGKTRFLYEFGSKKHLNSAYCPPKLKQILEDSMMIMVSMNSTTLLQEGTTSPDLNLALRALFR